jgi:hypothetical protein
MRTLLQVFLFGCLFLILANASQAQVIGHDFYRPSNNVYNHGKYFSDSDSGYSRTASSSSSLPSSPQDSYSYGSGDPGGVATRFMDHDQALALGRKLIANAAVAPLSELSVAEAARALKHNTTDTAISHEHKLVVQDDQGHLLICAATATGCRILSA